MRFTHFTGLATCLALTACSALSPGPQNDDALMEHLDESQLSEINTARAELDERADALATARRDVLRAEAEHDLAKADLDLVQARADHAEAAVAVAKTGTEDELREANEALHVAHADVAPQRDLIHWRKCEIARTEKAAALAERELELAEARVELVKARAYSETNQAGAREVDVLGFEKLVSERQEQAAKAEVELEAARRDCTMAQRTYDEATASSKEAVYERPTSSTSTGG